MYKTIVDFGDFTVEDTEYRNDSIHKKSPEYDIDYDEEEQIKRKQKRKEKENAEEILSAVVAVVASALFVTWMIMNWIIFGYGGNDMWLLPGIILFALFEFLMNGSGKGGTK